MKSKNEFRTVLGFIQHVAVEENIFLFQVSIHFFDIFDYNYQINSMFQNEAFQFLFPHLENKLFCVRGS